MSQNESPNQFPIPRVCMLDIETLDTKPSAVILSIGAVDVYGDETFYRELSQYQFGRTVSDATLEWWEKQPVPMPQGTLSIASALKDFHQWYLSKGFTEVWCKGSDFDFVILANAFRQIPKEDSSNETLETPWKYNHVRDFRTLSKLFAHVPAPLPYRVHNALTDAICQAAHLKEILNVIIRGQIYPSRGCSGCASSNQLRGAAAMEQWQGPV